MIAQAALDSGAVVVVAARATVGCAVAEWPGQICDQADVVISPTNPNSNAFSRDVRLLTAADYGQVFKSNRRVSNQHWTVLARCQGEQQARLGLAIAKKRARKATDRNRLKRVVRESFRHHQLELKGIDLVIMNKEPAAKASKSELRRSLDILWPQVIKQSNRSGR